MIIVTGLPRSGTSFIAKTLHTELGVEMGREFRAPWPGRDDFDFEDTDFVWCMQVDEDKDIVNLVCHAYFLTREQESLSPLFGVKTPFALKYLPELPAEATIIKTLRDPIKCHESVGRLPLDDEGKQRVHELIDVCHENYDQIKADYVIPYENTEERHWQIKEILKVIVQEEEAKYHERLRQG